MDPGQSPDWSGVGEASGRLMLLHFTIPKNKLIATFFFLNCSIRTIVIVLSNLSLDHLSFTVVANYSVFSLT